MCLRVRQKTVFEEVVVKKVHKVVVIASSTGGLAETS
jgi:hypothetical protein